MDADIVLNSDSVAILIANANHSTAVWKLTESDVTLFAANIHFSNAVHAFVSEDVNYIAIATQTDTLSSRGNVLLYTYNNFFLTKSQEIMARGPRSITTFAAKGKTYLVIANDRDFTEDGHSTYDVTVDVFAQTLTSFEWFQSIPTHRAVHVSTYQIGTSIYLSIIQYEQSISMYRFGYELGFEKVDQLRIEGARHANHFSIDHQHYLVISTHIDNFVWTTYATDLLKLSPIGMYIYFKHGCFHIVYGLLTAAIFVSGPDPYKVNMTDQCL